MELKPGYKQTEVGVIPEDWDVRRLGEMASIQRGASPRPIESPIWFDNNSSIGWVRISDVTASGTYLYQTLQKLSPLGVQQSRPVARGSLIMSICATVGRPVITKIDVCIHDGFVVFNQLTANKNYIYYVLRSIESEWSRNGQTGSQMNLNTGLINNTQIILPPLPEQSAIATALSDVDALLERLDQLITKKRNLKQAAMQQLLTGKSRLPGFSGEWEVEPRYKQTEVGVIPEDWEVVQLSMIADVRDGTHDSPKYVKDGIPFITSKNILSGIIDFNDITYISKEDAKEVDKRSKVDRGDILISMIGTVGNAALINFEPSFSIKNVGLIKLKNENVISNFIIQYLFSNYFKAYLYGRLDGGIQKFVSLGMLRSLNIPLPPLPEQRAIAEVLSDMNAEITALEKRRNKTRNIKQAMMQELLTGKTRLVAPGACNA